MSNQKDGAAPSALSPKERIAAAKEKSRAIAALVSAREEKTADEQEATRLELEAANAEALAEAELEHGKVGEKITTIDTRLGVIILKAANGLKYRQFADAGQYSSIACEKLVRPCRVHPSDAKLDEIFLELPATVILCANALVELAQGKRKEDQAKP